MNNKRKIYADNLLEITNKFLEDLSLIEEKLGDDYLINKGLFLMVYSFFEESVRQLMYAVLLVFPEKLPKDSCTISREQYGLLANDGHKIIIDNELYSIFRDGVRIQLEKLMKILFNKEYKKNKSDITAISDNLKETIQKLEEISFYRNALIHKGGKVSVEIYEKARTFKFWSNGSEINFSLETIKTFANEYKQFFLYLEEEIKKTFRFYSSVSNIEKLREFWNNFFSCKEFEYFWEIDEEKDIVTGIKCPKHNYMSGSEEIFLSIWRHQYFDVIKTREFLVCQITELEKFRDTYQILKETNFNSMYCEATSNGNALPIPKQLFNKKYNERYV
jgi:hypothetical protein